MTKMWLSIHVAELCLHLIGSPWPCLWRWTWWWCHSWRAMRWQCLVWVTLHCLGMMERISS